MSKRNIFLIEMLAQILLAAKISPRVFVFLLEGYNRELILLGNVCFI